jgi:Galactose oxidase, central domain/Kelch motif
MTDHAFEQDLRAAFREAVDQEAPASLRASVLAITDAVPAATNQRRSSANRQLPPWNRIVPIGLAAAAVVVTVVIGLSLIGQPAQKVGDPSAVPSPTQVAPTPPVSSSATGRMTIPREGHQALLLDDGRVLVHGGFLRSSSAEIYDPDAGTWTATAPTTEERPTLTLLADGRVLATGGQEPDDNGAPIASAELYDPRTEEWSATGSMTTARSGHTATLLADGTVLVAGSSGPDDVANAEASAELYDPSSGTWSATGSMVESRAGHTATLLRDGTVLVAGGYGGTRSAELYDPGTRTWRATGAMPQAHAAHTATLLPDGNVLVVGGVRMGVPDRGLSHDESLRMAADLYDPDTGSWAAAGMMTEYRLYHGATLLPDGRVLVTGGGSPIEDGSLATAEIYEPETGEWSASGNLVAPRSRHTATLLPDGRVLLAGGVYGESPPELLPSAELYEP